MMMKIFRPARPRPHMTQAFLDGSVAVCKEPGHPWHVDRPAKGKDAAESMASDFCRAQNRFIPTQEAA